MIELLKCQNCGAPLRETGICQYCKFINLFPENPKSEWNDELTVYVNGQKERWKVRWPPCGNPGGKWYKGTKLYGSLQRRAGGVWVDTGMVPFCLPNNQGARFTETPREIVWEVNNSPHATGAMPGSMIAITKYIE